MDLVVALPTRDELRNYVRQTLCERDRLDPGQTPLLEAPLKRSGRVCGLSFELRGPGLMRSHALWVSEEHRILFYDSTGERFSEVRLREAPNPQSLAAKKSDDTMPPLAA